MKKTYMAPEAEVLNLHMESMVCTSTEISVHNDELSGEEPGFDPAIGERLFGDFTPEPLHFLW